MSDANPTAPTYPVGAIAKLLLLTERRVQQLTKQGIIPKAERGRYELAPSVQGYIRYLHATNKPNGAAAEDYEKHRSRLYKARADAQEIVAERMKGAVHDAEVIAAVMNEMIANARAKLLSIPTLCAPTVADITDVNKCKEEITRAIYDVLNELSNYPADEIVARQLKMTPPDAEEEMESEPEPDPE